MIEEPDVRKLVTSLIQSELAKAYVYVVKNLKYLALGIFGFLVLASSALIGIVLLVCGALLTAGASLYEVGIAALTIGVVVILAIGGFLMLMLRQKFWIKTFHVDHVVNQALHGAK